MYPLLPRDVTHANLGCYLRTLCIECAGRVYVDMDPFAPDYTPAQARQLASDLNARKARWSTCEALLDFYEIQEDAGLSPGYPLSSARDSCDAPLPSLGVLLDGGDAEQTAIHLLQYGLARCVEMVLPALNIPDGLQTEQMAETLCQVKRSRRKRLEEIAGSPSAMSVVRDVRFILNALATYHLNWKTKGDVHAWEHQHATVDYKLRLLNALRKLRLLEDRSG